MNSQTKHITADWIAIDWGTTSLRAWAIKDGSVAAEASSACGMQQLDRLDFEPALLDLVDTWLATDRVTHVMCCGMVGSRQGWTEAPYRRTPCPLAADSLTKAPTKDPRLFVLLLPGICQCSPPDVMRGEETQIGGFLARNPGWDGVICLPGTHSKWVHVSADEVVSFQSFLTGELFALLSEQSILRHSTTSESWDNAAFSEALSDAMSRPETLPARLCRLRADDLLNGTEPAKARSTLSGLLIGTELAAAKPYWLGQNVAVIGADALAARYVAALQLQGVSATQARVDAMTLAGLSAAHRALEVAT